MRGQSESEGMRVTCASPRPLRLARTPRTRLAAPSDLTRTPPPVVLRSYF